MDKLLTRYGPMIMDKCGYVIKDKTGKNNFKANMVDFVLFSCYFIVSMINVFRSSPSIFAFTLNIILLWRLCLKNYFEQKKLCEEDDSLEEEKVFKEISKVHYRKICLFGCSSVFSFVILVMVLLGWAKVIVLSFFSGCVVFLTFVENIFEMAERLYAAQPKVLSFVDNKKEETICQF